MKFWLAVSTLVGTILGVGMFGLPAVVVEAGWWGTLVIGGLVFAVVLICHLAYAHVVALTSQRARLPGYARLWLGSWGERLAFFSQGIGLIGSSVAYILLGGTFLSGIITTFTDVPAWWGMALFVAAGAVVVWKGVRSVAETEFIMLLIMAAALSALAVFASPLWDVSRFFTVASTGSPWRLYGVLMFALWGMSVVPEAIEVIPKQQAGRMIGLSILAAALFTAVFVGVVLGVSGRAVSADALGGLTRGLGLSATLVGLGFGVFATFTSHIALTRTTMDLCRYDLGLKSFPAFFIAVGTPIVLLILGINDFVTVIAVTGAVSLGLEGALALVMEEHAIKKYPHRRLLHIPHGIRLSVIILLAAGIATELLATFGYL